MNLKTINGYRNTQEAEAVAAAITARADGAQMFRIAPATAKPSSFAPK